jgi:exodeoxyribonuclease VII large subunit
MNLVAPRLRRELLEREVERLGERLAAAWKMAQLVHPDRPLSRGFARVTDREGHTLIHAEQAKAAGELTLNYADGRVDVTVAGAAAPPVRPRVERKGRTSYVAPQPGLFDGED